MTHVLPQILYAATASLLLGGLPLSASESNSRENFDVKTRAKLSVAKSRISANGPVKDSSAHEKSTMDETPYRFGDDSEEEFSCSDLLIGVALGEVEEQYTLVEGTTSYDDGGCSE